MVLIGSNLIATSSDIKIAQEPAKQEEKPTGKRSTGKAKVEKKKEEYFSRTKFADMEYICDKTKRALSELKYETATEIQEKSIPAIHAGKNLRGAAKTGSGKTLAFLIPAIE